MVLIYILLFCILWVFITIDKMSDQNNKAVEQQYKIILNEWLKILSIWFALQAIPYVFSDLLFENERVTSIRRKIFFIIFSRLLLSCLWYMFSDFIKHKINDLKDYPKISLTLFIVITILFVLLLTHSIYNEILN